MNLTKNKVTDLMCNPIFQKWVLEGKSLLTFDKTIDITILETASAIILILESQKKTFLDEKIEHNYHTLLDKILFGTADYSSKK